MIAAKETQILNNAQSAEQGGGGVAPARRLGENATLNVEGMNSSSPHLLALAGAASASRDARLTPRRKAALSAKDLT